MLLETTLTTNLFKSGHMQLKVLKLSTDCIPGCNKVFNSCFLFYQYVVEVHFGCNIFIMVVWPCTAACFVFNTAVCPTWWILAFVFLLKILQFFTCFLSDIWHMSGRVLTCCVEDQGVCFWEEDSVSVYRLFSVWLAGKHCDLKRRLKSGGNESSFCRGARRDDF